MICKVFHSLAMVVILTGFCFAQDYPIEYVDAPFTPGTDSTLSSLCPPSPVPLEGVTDLLSDYFAGHSAVHQVGFVYPQFADNPMGLLKGRQLLITFPAGFGLSEISSVSVHDTDPNLDPPPVKFVRVYSRSVIIRFVKDLPAFAEGTFLSFEIVSVVNPADAGDYSITVRLDNRHGQTIAGPSQSEPFTILPGAAAGLEISPSADTTVQAGAGILFRAFITDEFGNRIEVPQAQWLLDPLMDQIGSLFGSFLQVTTVGTGRVLAHVDTLEAQSGLITVLPGAASVMTIETDAVAVYEGEPLPSEVTVEITDFFGNRVTDYSGAVWFTSDDPQAVIYHNEANPYQFTESDAGRAVFAGSKFVFQTAGIRKLFVTDGTLIGQTRIVVSTTGGGHFDVILPLMIVAGEPFEIVIKNAVDGDGNPYSGTIYTAGGQVAPDGSAPDLPAIAVINGQGSGMATLYATGANQLFLSGAGATRLVTVDVGPAALGSLQLTIDGTQFLDVPFRREARIRAYDEFGNRKSDFREEDGYVEFSSVSGAISPPGISADQFDPTGTAELSGFRYKGQPGLVTITALLVGSSPVIASSTDLIMNGVYGRLEEHYEVPDWLPAEWSFILRGQAWNPANLTPQAIDYGAGFIGGDSPAAQIIASADCIPQPNHSQQCSFRIDQQAGMSTGSYEYRITIEAVYEYDGELVTAVWQDGPQIDIEPFVPFTIFGGELPSMGFSADYSAPGTVTLMNENDYQVDAKASVSMYIENQTDEHFLARKSFLYGWESQAVIDLALSFSSIISVGQYQYRPELFVTIIGPDDRFRSYYTESLSLDDQIDIIARAQLSVDTASIGPSPVPANASIAFSFDLELSGTTAITLDGFQSTLTISDGEISATVPLENDQYLLESGVTQLTAKHIVVPESWAGKELTAWLHAMGTEAEILPVDTVIRFAFPVVIESSAAALQALSLVNNAANSPFVNTGQQFIMNGSFFNLSESDLDGPFIVTLRSDGQSHLPSSVTIPRIQAHDTVKVAFSVVAASIPSAAEVFSMRIEPPPGVGLLPAIDDNAVAVIQSPAQLQLAASIPGKSDVTAVLAYGESFTVEAVVINIGQAGIQGGRVTLAYTGPGDFGIDFPSELPLDSLLTWSLTAPESDINSAFVVKWTGLPADRNTGEPAMIVNDSVVLPFTVRVPETRLIVNAADFATRPLVRGISGRLFDLDFQNVTNDTRNIVALKAIMIEFADRHGSPILPEEILADTGTNFYIDGDPVSTMEYPATFPEDPPPAVILFTFDSVLLDPGGTLTMEFRLMPAHETNRDYFTMFLTGDMIEAEIADGPLQGEAVPVTGVLDRSFDINIPQSIIPDEFAASFKNYPNPFNPKREQTEIRYNLPVDSDVDIYIYTATGERVQHLHFGAGEQGGQLGLNAGIYWDGTNGEGDLVLNGVYIAYIEVAANGLTATLKMAVVK